MLQNLFYNIITLTIYGHNKEWKAQANFPHELDTEILNKMLAYCIQEKIKKILHYDQLTWF